MDHISASHNPFATPLVATPAESIRSRRLHSGLEDTTVTVTPNRPRRRFKSSRLIGEFEKPWLLEKKRQWNWDSIIFYTCVGIALAISGYICWSAYAEVPKHEWCMVLDEDFATLDTKIWNHEVQLNGFGTGSFDWTTTDPRNSYVDAEGLHIVPTLTLDDTHYTEAQLLNNTWLNLTADGTCTYSVQRTSTLADWSPCEVYSNTTSGQILPPVRSARLTTKGKKTIKYGRVEVVAKLAKGDWLWPAIWMMPEDSVYGEWPKSGEIDIVESRGNDAQTYSLGNNIVTSTLHWGTTYLNDAYLKSTSDWGAQRTKYGEGYHTYGLEWTEDYLFTWLDGRLRQVLYFDFTKNVDMWTYGGFAGSTVNKTVPSNPWSGSTRKNTPFDQEFYLILNVAVGGTNNYFPDNLGGKPWVDASSSAMKEFYLAQNAWLPSWGTPEERGMIVKSVKMWQLGRCG
ncbi:Glucan endo-1,3-beta-D-glucosidase [Penicillium ucsense]|uniref:Glucan endo-1,3-beta-D-glucosidase n=1 Tax=Penicillium ucsense TaxID=2839758 RepID=A0A8J8WGU9_9EURO|nr:Glucan endo-1,3-beta-D-glucosidase [Penicillium ucsense]KAF7730475.1 Glucan endo-1,3-beta-D-glucosidase [Penicillium ucsense]